MQSQNERKMELALVKEAARTKALQRKLEAAQNAADATTKVGEKMTESNAFYIEKLSEGQEAQIAFLNEELRHEARSDLALIARSGSLCGSKARLVG